MTVKNDHDSKFSNLSNWKEEARNIRASTGFEPVIANTGALLYQLIYEATHWERDLFIEFISFREEWNDVKYYYSSEIMWSISICFNWKIYCDDHSLISFTTAVPIWIIPYILHVIRHSSKIYMNSINWPGRASHRYSRKLRVRILLMPWFFSLFFNCLNWKFSVMIILHFQNPPLYEVYMILWKS